MKTTFIAALFMGGLLSSGFGLTYAADPKGEKEAAPTIMERLLQDTIKGTLTGIEGEYFKYFIIKDDDGKEHRIHVDKSTKRDPVKPGDKVKPM